MSDLRQCLENLREVGRYCGDMAKKEALDHKVRAAYFDAESRFMRALGELDYVVNLRS
jgi:hypothetical protein